MGEKNGELSLDGIWTNLFWNKGAVPYMEF